MGRSNIDQRQGIRNQEADAQQRTDEAGLQCLEAVVDILQLIQTHHIECLLGRNGHTQRTAAIESVAGLHAGLGKEQLINRNAAGV